MEVALWLRRTMLRAFHPAPLTVKWRFCFSSASFCFFLLNFFHLFPLSLCLLSGFYCALCLPSWQIQSLRGGSQPYVGLIPWYKQWTRSYWCGCCIRCHSYLFHLPFCHYFLHYHQDINTAVFIFTPEANVLVSNSFFTSLTFSHVYLFSLLLSFPFLLLPADSISILQMEMLKFIPSRPMPTEDLF